MNIIRIIPWPLILGLLLTPGARAEETADPCAASDAYAEAGDALPHVAEALRRGRLEVLALGSGAMLPPAAKQDQRRDHGYGEGSFPYRMAQALRAARPGLTVDMTVRAGKGLTAEDMLELMRPELPGHAYRLVIWQTGTVEAVRTIPPAEFFDTLIDGVALVQEAGADLVLVDPQFSRFLQTNANLDPYEHSLQQAAALPGVVLFHRFDLMREWAAEGRIDLEHAEPAERTAVADTLHACLGAVLARLVLNGAESP